MMMFTLCTFLGSCFISLCSVCKAEASEFFVSPEGRPDGDGNKERPLDFATALSERSPAKPGDTIWLLGGVYKGGFTSTLKGKADAPIIVRQYPLQRATIDCYTDRSGYFTVNGEWTIFGGFEVMCSAPERVTQITGSFPNDIDRGGINCQGSNISFVNMIIHDVSGGFGFWSGGEGGKIYGCLIYNNGWKGPDRGHGHAIYTQNLNGMKYLIDNIMFNQFSHGIHAYGSSRAFLKGFHVEGNVSFNNGSLAGENQYAPNILIGGGSPAERITVINNYTYHNNLTRTSVRLGYDAENEDMIAKSNYFVGLTDIKKWHKITLTNNVLIGSGIMFRLEVPQGFSTSGYEWNENTYYGDNNLTLVGSDQLTGFDTWQARTGIDKDSRYYEGKPKDTKVFIRPNKYEPGRAHIVVYNWERKDTVVIDPKSILKQGDKFKIVNAQDYFGNPVVIGVYDGKPISLSMTGLSVAKPIGDAPCNPPVTEPEFNVFIISK